MSVGANAIAEMPIAVAVSQLIRLGSGAATVEVRQIGDWGASPPTQISINLP